MSHIDVGAGIQEEAAEAAAEVAAPIAAIVAESAAAEAASEAVEAIREDVEETLEDIKTESEGAEWRAEIARLEGVIRENTGTILAALNSASVAPMMEQEIPVAEAEEVAEEAAEEAVQEAVATADETAEFQPEQPESEAPGASRRRVRGMRRRR